MYRFFVKFQPSSMHKGCKPKTHCTSAVWWPHSRALGTPLFPSYPLAALLDDLLQNILRYTSYQVSGQRRFTRRRHTNPRRY